MDRLVRDHLLTFDLPLGRLDLEGCEIQSVASLFADEELVSDGEEPAVKASVATVAFQVAVGLEEGFLGQIVRPFRVAAGQATQELTDRRLMPSDQLFERGVIILGDHASSQGAIRGYRSVELRLSRHSVSRSRDRPSRR